MNWIRLTHWLVLVAVGIALSGCVSNDISDLEAYAEEVLVRKAPPIDPPPEMKTFERYLYQGADTGARDPFIPFFNFEPKIDDGSGIDDEQQRKLLAVVRNPRNREELERHELDSLRMVGTLENVDDLWGHCVRFRRYGSSSKGWQLCRPELRQDFEYFGGRYRAPRNHPGWARPVLRARSKACTG